MHHTRNSPSQQAPAAALAALRELLGGRVRCDHDSLARYGIDRTTHWQAAPTAVVLPESVDEVQAIVRIARKYHLPLVPSGGRTGLSGGAVACRGEVVVAMERMHRVLHFDAAERSLTVEAGMITAQVQEFAAAQGLFYPVDFASSGSSQIGGNIATNAGGIRVIRHGMTRAQVTGLGVVDGRGELLELNRGLLKNNTGPDLRHLFIGSEGILGIITSATLQLQPLPGPSNVMLLALRDVAALLEALQAYRGAVRLSAFEFFDDNALRHVLAARQGKAPFAASAAFYALLEFDADEAAALACFARCTAAGWSSDGVLAQSLAEARELWRLRENISESLAGWTPWKNDVAVRLARMAPFMAEVEQITRASCAGLEVVWYGHIGDGNLHLNILKPETMSADEFTTRSAGIGARIAALVQQHGGSISAEHGVGLLKKPYLGFSRSPAEIELLRGLKRVFDPDGILNPGKIFDP